MEIFGSLIAFYIQRIILLCAVLRLCFFFCLLCFVFAKIFASIAYIMILVCKRSERQHRGNPSLFMCSSVCIVWKRMAWKDFKRSPDERQEEGVKEVFDECCPHSVCQLIWLVTALEACCCDLFKLPMTDRPVLSQMFGDIVSFCRRFF